MSIWSELSKEIEKIKTPHKRQEFMRKQEEKLGLDLVELFRQRQKNEIADEERDRVWAEISEAIENLKGLMRGEKTAPVQADTSPVQADTYRDEFDLIADAIAADEDNKAMPESQQEKRPTGLSIPRGLPAIFERNFE